MVKNGTRVTPGLRLDDLGLRAHHRVDLPVPGEPVDSPPIPIDVFVGENHHPCLALVAGVHGDEYDGIRALQTVVQDLPARVSSLIGSLMIIPVANPLAFGAGQRRTPLDDRDLNRAFPGEPEGTVSERLAHLLCRDLLRQADAVFSLHGASSTGILSPWVEFLGVNREVGRASYEMAMASGFVNVIALEERPGRLLRALGDMGVPLIEGEVGGRGTTVPENVAFYVKRVDDLARHLGVLGGSPEVDQHPRPSIWRLTSVEAEADGLFLREPSVELRSSVGKGYLLGRIVGSRGERLAEVRAPVDGVVGGYRVHLHASVGDGLITLWLPAGDLHV